VIELVSVYLNGEHGPILNDFCLNTRPGEAVALLGAAGSGRSAALAVASGAVQAHRGRVRLNGVEHTRRPAALRSVTGLSSPELMGPYDMSVAGWISYWSSAQGLSREDVAPRESKALRSFGLEGVSEHLVSQLSHSQRRSLDLARLWVQNPSVYLLDQPCAFLDGHSFWRLVLVLQRLKELGQTIIISTNEYNLPAQVCDRAVLMEKGVNVEEMSNTAPNFKEFVRRALGWKS
jgi:ABC-type multidrug transport system ATPase subunit